MNILYKEEKFRDEFLKTTPHLKLIFSDMCAFLESKGVKEVVITSVYRPENPKSVHAHFRGMDIRNKYFDEKLINETIEFINSKYIYDKLRPTMKTLISHGFLDNRHFHLQSMK